jgi:hypothetical protein
LYFPLLSCCNFHHDSSFMQNYEGPYTSLNWVFILFIFTIVYFRSLQCSTFCYEIYLYFPSIITYTSSSHSFVLLSRWFIIFLGLYVKVALTEIEYLYFSLSPCVLPRVTGRTSLIWWMIISFLQPFVGTLHFPKWTYVFPIDTMCTFHRRCVYFPKINIILRVIIGYTSWSLCLYFLEQKFCTSQKRNMYFL